MRTRIHDFLLHCSAHFFADRQGIRRGCGFLAQSDRLLAVRAFCHSFFSNIQRISEGDAAAACGSRPMIESRRSAALVLRVRSDSRFSAFMLPNLNTHCYRSITGISVVCYLQPLGVSATVQSWKGCWSHWSDDKAALGDWRRRCLRSSGRVTLASQASAAGRSVWSQRRASFST